jgi:Cu(I)-responsive transcriptional regulator
VIPIGRAAKASNLSVKTVRYYDEIRLVKPSGHSSNGYRLYDERDIRKLVFVNHARAFGFSIDTCRELLDLYENPARTSKEVKEITSRRLKEIRQKMKELQLLNKELTYLSNNCHGDERPDCPIIDFLTSGEMGENPTNMN